LYLNRHIIHIYAAFRRLYYNTIAERGNVAELLTTITTPLNGDNPFGTNINYDPQFDTLKGEIGKMGDIDYDIVENTALSLLKEKSKDVRILSFLSFAHLRNERWEEYADIFEGLSKLAADNYDALFPDRPRAKQNAIKWLSEPRYADMIAAKAPPEADHAHIVRLRESLEKLKPVLEQKFPDGSPFPSGLYSAARKWEAATKPKPKPEPGAAGAGGQGISEPMDTPKQAQGIGRKVALFLIEKEPQKPMGYRLLRSVRWDLLEKPPPADGGKTQLAGPAAEQRAFFQNQLAKNDWPATLAASEKAFGSAANHFWLDLQRISATACSKLGAAYEPVREAILTETALLLKRMPDLAGMAYADGSLFCDPATKDWIGAEVSAVLASGEGLSGIGAAGGDDDENSFENQQKEINAMVSSGKIEKALDKLHKQIRESSSERDNFRRSILLGNLLLSNKRSDIALAILESLDDKITSFNLDRWDPELAVEAWTLLIGAYKIAKANKPQNVQMAMLEKQNTILQKLSRTDPKSAFKIKT
jgi:type VI secretion system protein VasJ